MKLTPELVQAFVNLRSSGDFKVFLQALTEDVSDEMQRSLSLEGAHCHRAQGAALKLQSVYKAYLEAPATLEKLKATAAKK